MSADASGRATASAYPFDARPLTDPVDRREASAFARQLRGAGRVSSIWGSGSTTASLIVGAIVLAVFGSFFFTIVIGIAGALASAGDGAFSLIAVLPLLVFAAIAALVVWLVVRGSLGSQERWLRLDRFARANGMTYVPLLSSPGLPGMLFGQGSARQSNDLVRGDRPRFVEFANYRYTTGSGKNRTTHRWGYVAVKLDVPLPHIVLDATGNNTLFGSNLPLTFDRDQRLKLEGDFDRYFSLYCPAGYERDALYLFTPDIMARFIDNAAALDVEIVDDWLFLYAKRDFSTLDPATWAWLFSVVAALLDKLHQWERWRDERLRDAAAHAARAATGTSDPAAAPVGADPAAVPFAVPAAALRPPPGVAAPGRRLRRGVPWTAVVLFVLLGLYWLISQTGVLGLFFR